MNASTSATPRGARRALAALLAGLACTAAGGAERGIYVGGGVARGDYDLGNSLGFAPFDDTGRGYKLIAGFRPLDKLGVEVSYTDAGRDTLPTGLVCIAPFTAPCPTTARVETTAVSAFALGHVDLPLVDLFAKAGVANWRADADPFLAPGAADDGQDFAWGIGAAIKIRRFAARLEYERLDAVGGRPLDLVSVSVLWTLR